VALSRLIRLLQLKLTTRTARAWFIRGSGKPKHDPRRCPYCYSLDGCDHILLSVDTTFHEAGGGYLYDAFERRWSRICDEHSENPDFADHEAFKELLEEVDRLASFSSEFEIDGGPGACCGCEVYYVKSAREGNAAVRKFKKGGKSQER
jgi:hypothetical protein